MEVLYEARTIACCAIFGTVLLAYAIIDIAAKLGLAYLVVLIIGRCLGVV